MVTPTEVCMRRARIARRDVQDALSTFFSQLGLLRLIDVMLRHHIASVVAKEDAAKKAADNSWGNAPMR
jgi:hypothetical protein